MAQELALTTRAKTAQWTFSKTAANAALKELRDAAEKQATTEKTLSERKRAVAKALYHFVTTVMPVDELANMRRTAADLEEGVRWMLPVSVREYFDEKALPQPHFNAANPFLGLYQHFVGMARLNVSKGLPEEKKLTTQDEVEKAIADGSVLLKANEMGDEDAREAFRKKVNNNNTKHADAARWAALVCAAIDMADESILDANPRRVYEVDYPKFRQSNPSFMPLLPTRSKDDEASKANARERDDAAISDIAAKANAFGSDTSGMSDDAKKFAALLGGSFEGGTSEAASDDAEASAEGVESESEAEGATIDAEYEEVAPAASQRAIAGFKPFVIAPTATMARLVGDKRTVTLKVEIDADGKWRAVEAFED